MTIKQIEELRPEFQFGGGMTMVEWFDVRYGKGYCSINSGLKHADGETKSPYDYHNYEGGPKALITALKKFSDWWAGLNHEELYHKYGDDSSYIKFGR